MNFFSTIVCLVLSCQFLTAQNLKFLKTITEDSVHIDAANFLYGPVNFRLAKKDSCESIRMLESVLVGPNSRAKNIIAIPMECIKDTSDIRWTEFFTAKANLGDPANSKHNDSYLYELPFPKGKKYRIMQGWHGKFSHQSKQSKYALDFDMAIGDTICAAREGIVVRTDDHFTENGGASFRNKANQIVIIHDDGTLAFYVHLKHKGVLINEGDTINKGQIIGLSGNTGFSSKPHLHFVVREAPDKAVPIYFEDYPRKKLRQNKSYKNK